MSSSRTAILHYSAPPVIGGVEAVILAHTRAFLQAGYPVTVVAGSGEASALVPGADFVSIPEMDSQHPEVLDQSAHLEGGLVPSGFEDMVQHLVEVLGPILSPFDNVIVHNLFTKHFNLPLTAALCRLTEAKGSRRTIAWCHDFTWTSPSSRSKVHAGYPWDLLRTQLPDVTYVVVSKQRQLELAQLFACSADQISVVYNGVDPSTLLGLSAQGEALVRRLDLLAADIILLMPVRVTQAKNIEYALHVVSELKARDCSVRLVLTGPPDPHDAESMTYFHSLQMLRNDLGISAEMHFIYESGPDPEQGLTIDERIVGELYRVSDLMFMPSHREGFAMPVLEAGLAGLPVVCTPVPAAREIGGEEVILFHQSDDPGHLAARILDWAERSPTHLLRQRVRQRFTWEAIFARDIEPLLAPSRS